MQRLGRALPASTSPRARRGLGCSRFRFSFCSVLPGSHALPSSASRPTGKGPAGSESPNLFPEPGLGEKRRKGREGARVAAAEAPQERAFSPAGRPAALPASGHGEASFLLLLGRRRCRSHTPASSKGLGRFLSGSPARPPGHRWGRGITGGRAQFRRLPALRSQEPLLQNLFSPSLQSNRPSSALRRVIADLPTQC